ncbi:MAG TPA: PilT/PilU family type 4a pilus ATPase [Fredinandcohnia sp.]|nr:PilT/PilU family type 4a pilus ATPase [Fredinandcohnia sp.]
MSRLHQIIEKLYAYSGNEIHIEAGSTGYFRFPRGKRSIFREPLSPEQVRALFAEITPQGGWQLLESSGRAVFVHEAPAGAVEVTLVQTETGIAATIRPHAGGASGEPASFGASPIPGPVEAAPAAASPDVGAAEPDGAPSAAAYVVDPYLKTGEVLSSDPAQAMSQLFRMMVERRASDLHLVANSPPIFRIDGDLVQVQELDVLDHERLKAMLWSIAPERNREEWEEVHDTDFAHETDLARFRVNVFANRYGIAAVFRQIPNEILTAEQLNLPPALLELCHLTKGLVLVTGPTGSGKSTTLAAMVDYINRHRTDHILTIEDPIEFVHKNQKCLVNQREVGVHTQSFKRALRAALREDPDVVLVGEMRDLETIAIAIETAETGHLVFGTLHTTTAASTVDRVIDQFPADQQEHIRVMLSESLKGVIAQTLCKKIGGGRVAALEILLVNHAISNMIREGKTFQIPTVMQTSKGKGMRTLNDSLLELVRAGVVAPEEAYRKAVAKEELRLALEKEGIRLQAEE